MFGNSTEISVWFQLRQRLPLIDHADVTLGFHLLWRSATSVKNTCLIVTDRLPMIPKLGELEANFGRIDKVPVFVSTLEFLILDRLSVFEISLQVCCAAMRRSTNVCGRGLGLSLSCMLASYARPFNL